MGRLCVALATFVLLAQPTSAQGQNAGRIESPTPGEPVVVDFELRLIELPEIDTVANRFRFRAYALFRWMDPRMAAAEERMYLDQDAIDFVSKIWWPIPEVVNQVGRTEVTRRVVKISPEGEISFGGIFESDMSTAFDLRDFPFDSQTLEIQIESFAWAEDALVFRALEGAASLEPELLLTEWDVTDARIRVESSPRRRVGRTHSRVVMSIDIERHSGFYLWKVILPLLMIVALSWVVFWMPDEPFGGRTRISITGVLTVVAYQFVLADSLPKISYLTLLDAITTLSFMAIAATLFENLVVSRWRERDPSVAIAIDRTSRWAFPLGFALAIAGVSIAYRL